MTCRTQYRSTQETKRVAEDVGSMQYHTDLMLKTRTIKNCNASRHGDMHTLQISMPDRKLCYSLVEGVGGEGGTQNIGAGNEEHKC